MRRRRSRRRLRALSSRSCSPFERKKRRFLRSLRMPERCICVWNRFRSCSGSSPSRSVTKDKLPTLLELRRPTTEPAAHRRKTIIAVKARSCHRSRGPCSCCVVDEPDSIIAVRYGVDDAHCAPIRLAEGGNPFAEGFGHDREVKCVYYAAEQAGRHDIAGRQTPKVVSESELTTP